MAQKLEKPKDTQKHQPLVYQEQENGDTKVMGWEPYFEDWVHVSTLRKETKTVHPTHGYYPKHLYGQRVNAYARRKGYKEYK